MTTLTTALLLVSVVGLLAYVIWRQRRQQPWLFQSVALGIVVVVLHLGFGFPAPAGEVTPRGGADQLPAFATLYLAMVLGMSAQAVYARISVPRKDRPPFLWESFVVPVLASPVVFIPLLVVLDNAQLTPGDFSTARVMLWIVAFENGFFWKQAVDAHATARLPQGASDESIEHTRAS